MKTPSRYLLAAVGIACLLVLGSGCQHRRRPDPVRVVGNEPGDELSAMLAANSPPVPTPPAGPATGSPLVVPQFASIRVHVTGAVVQPGVYTLSRDARVAEAVQAAGGPAPDADLDRLNLADFVRDGDQVRVPAHRRIRGAPLDPASPPQPGEPASLPPEVGGVYAGRHPGSEPEGGGSTGRPAAPGGLVNVNSADASELDTLPGVGPVIAQRIIAYRRQHGPFQRPEDLVLIKGIGPKTFEKMRDRVTVR